MMLMQVEPEQIMGIASQSVREYETQSEGWEREHARECSQCEEWLAWGINAFEAISSAELLLRIAESQDKLDYTREMQDAMLALYELWLTTGTRAESWIASLGDRDHPPANAARFQEVIATVRRSIAERKLHREIVDSVDNAMLSNLARSNPPPAEWFEGDGDW